MTAIQLGSDIEKVGPLFWHLPSGIATRPREGPMSAELDCTLDYGN